jgi:hypothetical protein
MTKFRPLKCARSFRELADLNKAFDTLHAREQSKAPDSPCKPEGTHTEREPRLQQEPPS